MTDPILIPEDYHWEIVPVPIPDPKEVLVNVATVGITLDSNGCHLQKDLLGVLGLNREKSVIDCPILIPEDYHWEAVLVPTPGP